MKAMLINAYGEKAEFEAAEVQEWLEMIGKKMRRIAGENSA